MSPVQNLDGRWDQGPEVEIERNTSVGDRIDNDGISTRAMKVSLDPATRMLYTHSGEVRSIPKNIKRALKQSTLKR